MAVMENNLILNRLSPIADVKNMSNYSKLQAGICFIQTICCGLVNWILSFNTACTVAGILIVFYIGNLRNSCFTLQTDKNKINAAVAHTNFLILPYYTLCP
jgi:hypothetical protein